MPQYCDTVIHCKHVTWFIMIELAGPFVIGLCAPLLHRKSPDPSVSDQELQFHLFPDLLATHGMFRSKSRFTFTVDGSETRRDDHQLRLVEKSHYFYFWFCAFHGGFCISGISEENFQKPNQIWPESVAPKKFSGETPGTLNNQYFKWMFGKLPIFHNNELESSNWNNHFKVILKVAVSVSRHFKVRCLVTSLCVIHKLSQRSTLLTVLLRDADSGPRVVMHCWWFRNPARKPPGMYKTL